MKAQNTNPSLIAANMFLGFFFFNCCKVSFSAQELPYNVPSDYIEKDCSQDQAYNFRSKLANENINLSTVSRVYALNPYFRISACISRTQFSYPFYVSVGPKFVRLHFKAITYSGFNISKALFSVKVGQYTLLTTSKSSYSRLTDDTDYFVREFCINPEGQTLNVTFIPTSNISGAYAFFNRIEIVSMPSKLYIQEAVPLPLVGRSSSYTMDNSTALEMMHRLNIGGGLIPPPDDLGMFRLWTGDDHDFLSGQGETRTIESEVEIPLRPYAAPIKVYNSARKIIDKSASNDSARWSFPVDPGFYYLVRLHFCEISSAVQRDGQRVFHVYIHNQTAEDHADIFHWSHGAGIPTYRDYIVNLSTCGEEVNYLSISMESDKGSSEYPILNALEIFKLSDLSHNLSGHHPFGLSIYPNMIFSDSEDDDGNCIIISKAPFVLLLLFAASSVFWYPVLARNPKSRRKTLNKEQSSDCCRIFSFADIKSATNNFSDTLLIGRGGFGMVYKGSVDGGGTNVAIKRASSSSHQGLKEFQTEISMLSKLRHCHLVSLIGYSLKDQEMILVYDYMAQGTLRDHLYKTQKPPLPWKQRIIICIGAARGLHYLHTGSKNSIIHRDVKSSNILLDEELVAKVSDFGLSKVGPSAIGQSNTHVLTMVKGTFGYLDPEYYRRQKLTEKSYVYSFGVVLFETLCARPAVMPMDELNEEEYDQKVNLAEWALHCYQMGTLDQIIDPYLSGKIDPECFRTFTDIARKCLADRGSERPNMGDVLCNLELAMLQQNAADLKEGTTRKEANGRMNDDVSIMIDGGEQCICCDHSDKSPGVEFSEIMVPTGR